MHSIKEIRAISKLKSGIPFKLPSQGRIFFHIEQIRNLSSIVNCADILEGVLAGYYDFEQIPQTDYPLDRCYHPNQLKWSTVIYELFQDPSHDKSFLGECLLLSCTDDVSRFEKFKEYRTIIHKFPLVRWVEFWIAIGCKNLPTAYFNFIENTPAGNIGEREFFSLSNCLMWGIISANLEVVKQLLSEKYRNNFNSETWCRTRHHIFDCAAKSVVALLKANSIVNRAPVIQFLLDSNNWFYQEFKMYLDSRRANIPLNTRSFLETIETAQN